MGSINLGNQWTSMRKTRLTCVYNNTYLNDLEDVVRVDDNTFIALFTLRLLAYLYIFFQNFYFIS
jgi:hypothetical protein